MDGEDVEAAVKGGSVYAAGGGGWADHGRMLGTAAVNAGRPELVSIDEVPRRCLDRDRGGDRRAGRTRPWEMLGVDYVKAVRAACSRRSARRSTA